MINETIGWLNKLLAPHVRYVESEDELRVVSELDRSVYGGESISHEGLCAWWRAYKKGVYVLQKDKHIIGAIGIWPIKKATFNKLIKGRLDEVELTAEDISGRLARRTYSYWYFADIILEKQYRDTLENLALFFIEETLRLWLNKGSLAPRIHVCALGFENEGIKLLKHFNFQFPEGAPVTTRSGKPAFMRTLTVEEIQQEISHLYALRRRLSTTGSHTPLTKERPEGVKKETRQIKILILAASPADADPLNLQQEVEAIDKALYHSRYRDRFDIAQHSEVRVDELASYLLRHSPDIVHFSGHGSVASEIILEDESGNSHPVPVEKLSKLFSLLKENIRCVVLNACYSEGQARAIAAHIDCVVGMAAAIRDDSAIKFSASFYEALGYGKNVRTAYGLGCYQIDSKNLNEQNVPKLICKQPEAENTVFVSDVV